MGGPAKWHYGSYFLWGDVPALMPFSTSHKTAGVKRKRDGASHTRHLTNPAESLAAKGGGRWFHDTANPFRYFKQEGLPGSIWFDRGLANFSSQSTARKAASAIIAEIPGELSSWIARCFLP